MRQSTFEKKKPAEIIIAEIIEFELRRPRPPNRTCTSATGYFYDKKKNLKGKSSGGLLFTFKILHEAMYLAFPC